MVYILLLTIEMTSNCSKFSSESTMMLATHDSTSIFPLEVMLTKTRPGPGGGVGGEGVMGCQHT